MKRLNWVLFIFLLLLLMANFVFISNIYDIAARTFARYNFSSPNLLLKDILFMEGFFLMIFGIPSSEYVWKYLINRKNRQLNGQRIESGVGFIFLIFGLIYVSIALVLPV